MQSVFIARLPFGIQADEVEKAFSIFGPILNGADGIQVRDGRNGCYAFVTFEYSISAAAAIEKGVVIQGRCVDVELRNPQKKQASAPIVNPELSAAHVYDTEIASGRVDDASNGFLSTHSIFIARLPFGIQAEEVEQVFSLFGPILNGADGIQVRDGRNGCYAFLTFENSVSVAVAVAMGAVVQGRRVDVKPRYPKKKLDSSPDINPELFGVSAQDNGFVDDASNGCLSTHSIFIARLPIGIRAEEVESEFSKFGPILNGAAGIQVRDGRKGCYAFLTFENSSSAVEAIEKGAIVQGRRVYINPSYTKKPLSATSGPPKSAGSELTGGASTYETDSATGCGPREAGVFIAQLPFGIQADEIEKAFSIFGPILDGADGIQIRDGRKGCYAFLTFEDSASAAAAIAIGTVIQGRRVEVEPRRPDQDALAQEYPISPTATPPARRVRKALRLMPPDVAHQGGDALPKELQERCI